MRAEANRLTGRGSIEGKGHRPKSLHEPPLQPLSNCVGSARPFCMVSPATVCAAQDDVHELASQRLYRELGLLGTTQNLTG